MSSWEEAVKKLFQSHPRVISSKTVIEAIKSAPENSSNLPLESKSVARRTEIENGGQL